MKHPTIVIHHRSVLSVLSAVVVLVGLSSLNQRNTATTATTPFFVPCESFSWSTPTRTTTAATTTTTSTFETKTTGKISIIRSRGLQPSPSSLQASLGNILDQQPPTTPRPDVTDTTDATTSTDTSTDTGTAATGLDWSSVVDQVYVITCPNADSQKERITSTTNILRSINLLDKDKDTDKTTTTTIKEFQTDDDDRIRGCYTSHVQVLREAMMMRMKAGTTISTASSFGAIKSFESFVNELFKKPRPTSSSSSSLRNTTGGPNRHNRQDGSRDFKVLVIEDNLAFGSGGRKALTQDVLDTVSSYLNSNDNGDDDGERWDVLHLCYNPYVPNLQISKTLGSNDRIVRLSCGEGSALGTTAYIINANAIRTLLEEDERVGYTGEAIPDVMSRLFPTSRYATNPTFFVRAPATKSLVNPQLDDLRQVLFQPSIVSFSQQLLVTTGLSTNNLLPLVILSLLTTSFGSLSISYQSVTQYVLTGSLDGPWIVPVVSVIISIFSLAVIVQGALLAPKPTDPDTTTTTTSNT